MKLTELQRKRLNEAAVVDNIVNAEPLMIIDDVRVIYAPTVMKLSKMCCCAVTTFTVRDLVFKIIIVDDTFIGLTDVTKRVAIYHELGHIENGDIENSKSHAVNTIVTHIRNNIFQKEEFLADLNACYNVGFTETCHGLEEAARAVGSSKVIRRAMKRILALKINHLLRIR